MGAGVGVGVGTVGAGVWAAQVGRRAARVAWRWVRNAGEASSTMVGVMMCGATPSVHAALRRFQSGARLPAMSRLSARSCNRGHASQTLRGTQRESGSRQKGMTAALGALCVDVARSMALMLVVAGVSAVVASTSL
eukprot:758329-Ditylum_brightwellii.AAC.1